MALGHATREHVISEDRQPIRHRPLPRAAWAVASLTAFGAIALVILGLLFAFLWTGLGAGRADFQWQMTIPFLLAAAVYAIVAIGIVRTSRAAFVTAAVLHSIPLLTWIGLVASGNEFALEPVSLAFIGIAAVAIACLVASRREFWRPPPTMAQ